MRKAFYTLFKKDYRILASGRFFLTAIGFLALYTAYVNLGYIRFMQMEPYNVYTGKRFIPHSGHMAGAVRPGDSL